MRETGPFRSRRILGGSVGLAVGVSVQEGSGCDDARPGERQAEEVLIAANQDVHLRGNGCVQDRLIGGSAMLTLEVPVARSQDRSA